MVLFSVIMPSYNHAKYLPETITSVLNQSFRDFELIIIDDCSKDNSREIIRKFKEKDNRIINIFHETNKGISRTYNDGIEYAKGKFVSFIDSDDVWNNNLLEKEVQVLEKNDNLIIWTEGELINSEGKIFGITFTQRHYNTSTKKQGNIFNELLKYNFILSSGFTIKRENLKEIRFNPQLKFINDVQFFIDLAYKYEYSFIKTPLAKYRLHNKNTIDVYPEGYIRDLIKLSKFLLKKYRNKIPLKIRWRYHHFLILKSYFVLGWRRKLLLLQLLLYIIELIIIEISCLGKRNKVILGNCLERFVYYL